MFSKALIVFFFLLGFTGADCPNGCNNMTFAGRCVNNECQCSTDTSNPFLNSRRSRLFSVDPTVQLASLAPRELPPVWTALAAFCTPFEPTILCVQRRVARSELWK